MSSEKLSRRQQELADYRREGFLPSGKLDLTTLNINQVHHLIDWQIKRAINKVDNGVPVDIYSLSVPACTLLNYFIDFGQGEWVAQKFGEQKIDLNNFVVPQDNNRWHLLTSLIEYGDQAAWVANHLTEVAVSNLNDLPIATEIILTGLINHGQAETVLQKLHVSKAIPTNQLNYGGKRLFQAFFSMRLTELPKYFSLAAPTN